MKHEDENYSLVVTYKYTKPVDLQLFSDALKYLGADFKKHLKAENIKYDNDTKLYIKTVKEGSIDVVLITALAAMENINILFTFHSYLKEYFWSLSGRTKKTPDYDKAGLVAKQAILAPVNNNADSVFEAKIVNNYGNIFNNCHFAIPQEESLKITSEAEKQIKDLEAKEADVINNTLLVMYQVSRDERSFKGIIPSISKQPQKVVFDSPELKDTILDAEENMFKKAYCVNVRVEKLGNKIAFYNVLKIKDILDFTEETEN